MTDCCNKSAEWSTRTFCPKLAFPTTSTLYKKKRKKKNLPNVILKSRTLPHMHFYNRNHSKIQEKLCHYSLIIHWKMLMLSSYLSSHILVHIDFFHILEGHTASEKRPTEDMIFRCGPKHHVLNSLTSIYTVKFVIFMYFWV